MKNIILNADSYKASHYLQYPEGVTGAYSYIESRGGMYDETLFFGLQGFMKEYLEGKVVTRDGIEEAAEFFEAHGEPFNRKGWEYILSVHKGRLPVRIRAVREGAFIPTGNVLVSSESTDPVCAWLPSYLETSLLRAVWYPTTVATRSARIRAEFVTLPGAYIDFTFMPADGLSSGPECAVSYYGPSGNFMCMVYSDNIDAVMINYGRALNAFSADVIGSMKNEG